MKLCYALRSVCSFSSFSHDKHGEFVFLVNEDLSPLKKMSSKKTTQCAFNVELILDYNYRILKGLYQMFANKKKKT